MLIKEAYKLAMLILQSDYYHRPDIKEAVDNMLNLTMREHNTNSEWCWCEPDIEYVKGGGKVIVHRKFNG